MRQGLNPTVLFFAIVLLVLGTQHLGASIEGQTTGGSDPPDTGSAPWSTPKWQHPDDDRSDSQLKVKIRTSRSFRCEIQQVEEQGRLYVVELAGRREEYWIQLPNEIKIVTSTPQRFDGRKKLKVEDLEVGQRIEVTVRGEDTIRKVRVLRAGPEP